MEKTFINIKCILVLCLCLTLTTGYACAEMTEISCGKVEYLHYQCTLPDGRLLLTGGTRRAESGGDAAWLLCLNPDRSVSWEIISRKDGYTSAETATVLEDGTVAVLMENYPEKRAVKFFTPEGKNARKKLDLKKKPGNVYTIGPSFLIFYDSESKDALDYRYKTFLFDWNGKEITRYDGLVMRDGYGYTVRNDEELVLYGQDTVYNSHAMMQKLDVLQDRVLWETVLEWQLPGTDTAMIDDALKTADGGYVAWLREGKPGDSYEWNYLLVKFDAEGRLLWTKDKTEYGRDGILFLYNGKIGILSEESPGIDSLRLIQWFDADEKKLGTTELRLHPDDFTVLRDYLEAEDPEEKRTTFVDQIQFIPMEDGLWAMATCWAALDLGEEGFSTIFDSQEIVLIRIPEL